MKKLEKMQKCYYKFKNPKKVGENPKMWEKVEKVEKGEKC